MSSSGSAFRNLAVVGQETSGKTTLIESILLHKKIINRLGSVQDGNTVCDYEPEELDQSKSIFPACVSFKHDDHEVSLLDVPGALDFLGQSLPVLYGVDAAICCIDAPSGVKITSRQVWKNMDALSLPRFVVVTRADAENADFSQVVNQVQEVFGSSAVPLYYPDGDAGDFSKVYSVLNLADDAPDEVKAAREALIEKIVEADEDLLEKYLEGEEISQDDLNRVFSKAVLEQSIYPIFVTSAEKAIGVAELLEAIIGLAPSPADRPVMAKQGDEEVTVDPDGGFVGQVIKVWADDFLGRLSFIRIFAGSLQTNGSFVNRRSGKTEKYGNVLTLFGKKQNKVDSAGAGQIIAIGKVEDMAAGDTLTSADLDLVVPFRKMPTPLSSLAVSPKAKGEEQRLSNGVRELASEDPCFVTLYDDQTHELVISGLSDFHVNIMLKRLKRRRKVELETKLPRIPYQETVTKPVKYVEYTHKKQSGGAGQFARVYIDLEPMQRGEGYEFLDKIFGGSIDQPFRPSVDKGVQAKMKEGVLAGYRVVDVRVALVDGKTHPVDSKDIAFQLAGKKAFEKAFLQAGPVLLEPIVKAEITVPQQYMGDIMGDLNSRRGSIQDTQNEGGMSIIVATVPLAEIQNYAADLKSITGGEGTYSIDFDRYDSVPSHLQDKIVQQSKAGKEEAS